jgi:hypothetical protein
VQTYDEVTFGSIPAPGTIFVDLLLVVLWMPRFDIGRRVPGVKFPKHQEVTKRQERKNTCEWKPKTYNLLKILTQG